mgnify:FL=1
MLGLLEQAGRLTSNNVFVVKGTTAGLGGAPMTNHTQALNRGRLTQKNASLPLDGVVGNEQPCGKSVVLSPPTESID